MGLWVREYNIHRNREININTLRLKTQQTHTHTPCSREMHHRPIITHVMMTPSITTIKSSLHNRRISLPPSCLGVHTSHDWKEKIKKSDFFFVLYGSGASGGCGFARFVANCTYFLTLVCKRKKRLSLIPEAVLVPHCSNSTVSSCPFFITSTSFLCFNSFPT